MTSLFWSLVKRRVAILSLGNYLMKGSYTHAPPATLPEREIDEEER